MFQLNSFGLVQLRSLPMLYLNYHKLQPGIPNSDFRGHSLGSGQPVDKCNKGLYHSHVGVLINHCKHFFFLIREIKFYPPRTNQHLQPANRIPKQFFYLKRCLVSHMVMEDENTLSTCILDLFKILKCCIYRDEVEGQLSLWEPLCVLPLWEPLSVLPLKK